MSMRESCSRVRGHRPIESCERRVSQGPSIVHGSRRRQSIRVEAQSLAEAVGPDRPDLQGPARSAWDVEASLR